MSRLAPGNIGVGMSKKKKPPRRDSPFFLLKEDEQESDEQFDSDESHIGDFQTTMLYYLIEHSLRGRTQFGSIQIMLLVICVLLALHFFGWVTALVVGIVLGLLVFFTLVVAISPYPGADVLEPLAEHPSDRREDQDE